VLILGYQRAGGVNGLIALWQQRGVMAGFWSAVMTGLNAALFFLLSPFGINYRTPEPAYRIVDVLADDIDVRLYQPRVVAQIKIKQTDDDKAQREAFGVLAGYIFGANQSATVLAMTAPVEMPHPQKLAMTAPVQRGEDGDDFVMRFFLPADVQLNSAPVPHDQRIKLIQLAERYEAVVRFSGRDQPERLNFYRDYLLHALTTSRWHPHGMPTAYLYNPPWTLPPLRRNEMSVVVSN
jgi:hypothetical protein